MQVWLQALACFEILDYSAPIDCASSLALAVEQGPASLLDIRFIHLGWPADYLTGEEAVYVHVRGGETLSVRFIGGPDCGVTSVCLEIPVRAIYDGEFRPELMQELRSLAP